MRSLVLVVFALGCAPALAEHAQAVTLAASVPAEKCAAPLPRAEESVAMCLSPRGSRDDFTDKGLKDLMFASCDDFMPEFQRTVGLACIDAARPLSNALQAAPTERKRPSLYAASARAERNRVFAEAALPLLAPRCRKHFPASGIPGDDVDRPIYEVDADWRQCQPDGEFASANEVDYGDSARWSDGHIAAGAHLFAVAIAPHLTPLGKQYLRKFLQCEMNDIEALHGPD
jgi:hypothetical protein